MAEDLTFRQFSEDNAARCEAQYHPLHDWAPWDWSNALAGEAGELCNLTKKLRRIAATAKEAYSELGLRGLMRVEIENEIADVVTYCDILATAIGADLGTIVARKFDAVSRRSGYDAVKLFPTRVAKQKEAHHG